MASLTSRIEALSRKLYWSKMRLLVNYGFFGLLLLDIKFMLTTEYINSKHGVSTNGEVIYFDLEYLSRLKEQELDIVIMHEIMHIVLKHTRRGEYKNNPVFAAAADIVVNSNIMYSRNDGDKELYVDGVKLEHLLPNGQEGYLYSVDEVYEMLLNQNPNKNKNKKHLDSELEDSRMFEAYKNKDTIDSHNHWGENNNSFSNMKDAMMNKKIMDAYSLSQDKKEIGAIPKGVERIINQLKNPRIDWKTYLNNFVQEEINDYSFAPPDKRFMNTDFLLPDFNDKEDTVKNILFMVDCSGSMNEEEITSCFAEIKGAIDQFNGKLEGQLGFFDTKVYDLIKIDSDLDIIKVKPIGGGGTDVLPVFTYIKEKMKDNPPSSVVILTDGYFSEWPKIEDIDDMPLLWIINNENKTPPFGKVARI